MTATQYGFDALALRVGGIARRWWWIPLVTGVLWILVSVVLFRFDVTSAKGVGIIAGVVFLTAGAEELAASSLVEGAWRWIGLAFGVILIAAGVYALINPLDTFVALAALVGWVLLIKGLLDVALALLNRDLDLWWLRLVVGFIELGLALVVSGNFVSKAVFLVAFIGALAMLKGITDVILAMHLRALGLFAAAESRRADPPEPPAER